MQGVHTTLAVSAESFPTVGVTFVSPCAIRGGAEAVLRDLISDLGPEWVRGIVLLQDGPLAEELHSLGHEVRVIPTSSRLGMLRSAFRLRGVLLEQRPAVVHANGVKAALISGIAASGLSTRTLWMKHDTAGDRMVSRLVALGSDAIVGVSNSVLQPFRGRLRARSTVVYNGVTDRPIDRRAGRQSLHAALACPPDAPVVLLAGRLCTGKGQRELIGAAPRILAAHPQTRFALVGDDDPAFPGFGERLREQVRELDLEHAVTFLGWRADVTTLISGADIVAVPSVVDAAYGWREGFGLVGVEALQACTPVIGYASGALPEVLGPAATLVPEGDRTALACEIVSLLDRPEGGRDGAAVGQARVRRLFRRDVSVEGMRDQYRALANQP